MEQALSALGGAVQGVHPFVIYLAGINALTFILFAIDYAIARYNQDEDTGLMDGRILTLFAVAGGALGMLLALMIFTRNHMNKHNIAWWFSAIVFLIVWVFVVLVWAGVIVVDLEPGASFNAPVIVALGAYLLAINVITFAVFCLDKKRAIDRDSRFPRGHLAWSLARGRSPWRHRRDARRHHKTSKWYFAAGLPACLILHVALFLLAHARLV